MNNFRILNVLLTAIQLTLVAPLLPLFALAWICHLLQPEEQPTYCSNDGVNFPDQPQNCLNQLGMPFTTIRLNLSVIHSWLLNSLMQPSVSQKAEATRFCFFR